MFSLDMRQFLSDNVRCQTLIYLLQHYHLSQKALSVFTCSKPTIKALEHGLKPGSKSIETLEQHHKSDGIQNSNVRIPLFGRKRSCLKRTGGCDPGEDGGGRRHSFASL